MTAEPKRLADDPAPTYDVDNLRVHHKTVGFLRDPRFHAAYRRGMDSGHHISRPRECYELAKSNFASFPSARLIRGRVPDAFDTVKLDRVAYLSIDMNIAAPEVAALRFFWERLAPGAPVALDDYGWQPHLPQKEAMDALAIELGVNVLELPTGQGLLLKPTYA